MNLYTIANISFIITRYSEESMQAVYGSVLLPYISSSHTALIYRLFENAHHRHNPANSQDIGVFHLPLSSTLQNAKSGDYAHIATNQRKIISNLITKCTYCILHGASERLYSHKPGDPRIIDFLHSQDLPFHTVSIDWLSEIAVKHHSKARGKPSHTVSVLVALDLATGGVCLTVASDRRAQQ